MSPSNPQANLGISYRRYPLRKTNHPTLFFYGMLAPLRAIKNMFRRPRLWGRAGLALFVNVLVIFFMLILALVFADDIAQLIWLRPTTSAIWLWRIFVVVTGLLLLVCGFLISLILIVPLATPFLQSISRDVEQDWLGPLKTAPLNWLSLLPRLPSLVGLALKRLIKFILISLPVMVLLLIPVVGPPLAVVLEFTVGGLFIAVGFLDFPLDRRGYSRREKGCSLSRHCLP